ncbi:hypothetical protein SAMN04244572_03148 [Azotobacter beijerinckii]|uniref:Mu-like prophage protein gp37 n=1 Tax=Azotobacter beijerinckii TaxID=170623 RepID=A0A1H6X9Q5_9GAMM|nr:phage tail protein [Azotobacter beijerinckii]SEJ21620.1 hypothetical protein SAMN04244572_03148 [Azotobacter beijerinckii]
MTTTADMRALAAEALKGRTDAGLNVFSARTWPTWDGQYPLLYLHTPAEDMESLGRHAPQFTVTATLKISARVRVPQQTDNAGAAQAQLALEQIQDQAKRALINNPALMSRLQQFPFIRSEFREDGEGGSELAELVMEVGMEFYQGPEDFYPLEDEAPPQPVDAVTEIASIQPIVPLDEISITEDLINVADATGTYPDAAFPDAVAPAPRSEGPDGRAEGGITIDFMQ